MNRFGRWTVVLAAMAVLLAGLLAPAAVAGGHGGSGVTTMQPFSDPGYGTDTAASQAFSDPSWGAVDPPGLLSMQPFSDPSYGTGTTASQAFSDPTWGVGDAPGVTSMRPFSDPNAIGHVPARTAADGSSAPRGSGGGLKSLTIVLAVAVAALLAGALGYASRQRRARPV